MALVIEHLGRRYGSRWAISDLSLVCESGMLGLVGPNGAGKTTLMRIIATLLPPTTGTVRWNGLDVGSGGQEIRARLGYLPQQFGVYPEFSARRFLRYLAAMKRLAWPRRNRRVDEVLELVNLEADADRRLSTYSGGMLQRVGIAQALLNDPDLLVADEPTAGLDPSERVRFRTLLAGLTANRLVILSTHIVTDVEAVAGRLVVMRAGTVLADTSPEALVAAAAGSVWALSVDAATAARLQATEMVSGMVADGPRVTVRLVTRTPPAGAWAVAPTLEDAYLLTVGSTQAAT
ncbi:MAG TPA: ABC transporter ATP-binding protein [Candidatus Dormibacteraeota bacterium]